MSQDIFVPTTPAKSTSASPLHTITYVTAEKDKLHKTLTEGFELESSGWETPSAEQYATLNPYFGFPASSTWEICNYFRRGPLANVQVRVISVSSDNPQIRPAVNGLYTGGLSIGFPMHNMPEREEKLAGIGIESSVGLKTLEFSSPAGDVYVSGEIHFLGPENIFLLGVFRPDVFVPVGPMEHGKDIGAAAYSARCVIKTAEVMEFCQQVLGYEVRRDMAMEVGERSGLRLPVGIPERFIQIFAPGASSGYLVLLNYEDKTIATPAPSQGSPNRGVTMWSFSAENFDAIYARAVATKCEILAAPAKRSVPGLPDTRTMIIKDPDGFPIEIFEQA